MRLCTDSNKPCSTEKRFDILDSRCKPLSISNRWSLLGMSSAAVYLDEVNAFKVWTIGTSKSCAVSPSLNGKAHLEYDNEAMASALNGLLGLGLAVEQAYSPLAILLISTILSADIVAGVTMSQIASFLATPPAIL